MAEVEGGEAAGGRVGGAQSKDLTLLCAAGSAEKV